MSFSDSGNRPAVATSLAAGLQLILVAGFSMGVTLARLSTKNYYGTGGNGKEDISKLSSAQRNISEYAPVIILAIFLSEINGLLSTGVLTAVGVSLFMLRLAAGLNIAYPKSIPALFRRVGFISTIFVLVWLAVLNISLSFAAGK